LTLRWKAAVELDLSAQPFQKNTPFPLNESLNTFLWCC